MENDKKMKIDANLENNKYVELINKGQLLQAVKEYKEDNNCSLKEAKDYIDNLRGYDPKKDNRGCLGVVALLVLLSSTAIYFCL